MGVPHITNYINSSDVSHQPCTYKIVSAVPTPDELRKIERNLQTTVA